MAANLNYNVNVNTTAGVQALNTLQSKVAGVNSAFGGLKNALAGIAIGGIITNLLSFADNIKDLSDATGLATANILGFQKAVLAAGGSADGADKAILKLVQNIGAANDGSAELQAAFGKVGVTLNDLATLSEQDILKKTIEGLARLTDKSEQANVKQAIFQKTLNGVAASGLPKLYADATQESQKYAGSLDRVAELQGNLEKAIGRVKLVLLELLDPIAKFINSMDQERVSNFIENLVKLAAAVVALSALGRATAAIQALQVAFGGLLATTLGLIVNVLKFGTIIGRVLTGVGAAAIALAAIFPETAAKINKAVGEATDAVKDFFGFTPADNSTVINNNTAAIKDNASATEDADKITRQQKAAIDQLKDSLSAVTGNFIRLNEQNLAAINLQTELIGKTKEEIDVNTAKADITKRASEETAKLREQLKKLNDAQKQQGGEALINAEIAKIEQRAKIDTETTEQAIKNLEAKRNAYEALKAIQDFAYKSEIDGARKVQDIMDDMNTRTMGSLEKSYAEIAIASRKSADAAIDAENSRRRSAGLAKLTADETARYYEEAAKGNEALKRATEQSYNNSRTFATGWKKAFNDYAEDASNAAKTAENLFKKATQGMEDLIVTFVKTGKFNFKDFAKSIAEDLLRSNLKQVISSIFGGSTGDGLGGILAKLSGAAGGAGGGGSGTGTSANNPMYVYDVAGGGARAGGGDMGQEGGGVWESVKNAATTIWDGVKGVGSGIYDAVSGVVDSIGSIFNSSSGGGGGGGFLDSIASGIGSFFGGFFANGGQIGAGKFGVVGENGPELVGGPATVTPMTGGSNVTYNINAVDAQSFKAMIAADPSFIHGVAMMGARSSPARR